MTSRARGHGVRVIAGTARGRRLQVPRGGVRPTKDRVKEAVFSALDARDALRGASVLDLYAGSGALSVEALSRGAARAVLVERERHAVEAIVANVEATGFADRVRLDRRPVSAVLAAPPPGEAPFDLVFCDPPYATTDHALRDTLGALWAPGWLSASGLVVVERPAAHPPEPPEGSRVDWLRRFGDTLVAFVPA